MTIGDIMDYNKYSCPVCSKHFEKNDEIVVCPVCGTPHHRDCYDRIGACYYKNRHKDGYDFTNDSTNDSSNNDTKDASDVVCLFCGTHNPHDATKCTGCGAEIFSEKSAESSGDKNKNTGFGSTPTGGMPFPAAMLDPLGGVNPDEDIHSGVTAAECAKFTKNNTQFFVRLFHQIKTANHSRFSFVGLIFGGGWMLYRKMYKLGSIFAALQAAFMFLNIYLNVLFGDQLLAAYKTIQDSLYGGVYRGSIFSSIGNAFASIENHEVMIAIIILYISSTLQLILKFVCGFCCNRWYFKHCIKSVSKIKQNAKTKDAAVSEIEEKGGVNTPLAISLLVSYIIMQYLPSFF